MLLGFVVCGGAAARRSGEAGGGRGTTTPKVPRGAEGWEPVEGGGYEREPRRCPGDAQVSSQVRRRRRRKKKREGEGAASPGESGEPWVGLHC